MIGRQQQGHHDNRFQQWVSHSLNRLVVLGRTVLKESWLKGLETFVRPRRWWLFIRSYWRVFAAAAGSHFSGNPDQQVSEQQRATQDSEMLMNEGQEKSCWLGDKQKNDFPLKVNKVLDQNLLLLRLFLSTVQHNHMTSLSDFPQYRQDESVWTQTQSHPAGSGADYDPT